jgi:hypothetical protein
MYKDNCEIEFKHYKTGETLILSGVLPEIYNPEKSDYYVLLKKDGELEDIRKESVISLRYL